jgi:hypothetical protein
MVTRNTWIRVGRAFVTIVLWMIQLGALSPRAYAQFGSSIASIADVNGDGISDVIGLERNVALKDLEERVWVLSGSDLRTLSKVQLPSDVTSLVSEFVLCGLPHEQELLIAAKERASDAHCLLRYRLKGASQVTRIALERGKAFNEFRLVPDSSNRDRCERKTVYAVARTAADVKGAASTWVWRINLGDDRAERFALDAVGSPDVPSMAKTPIFDWAWSLRASTPGSDPILAVRSEGKIAVFFAGLAAPPTIFEPPSNAPSGFGLAVACCPDEDEDGQPEVLISAHGETLDQRDALKHAASRGTIYWYSSKTRQPYRELADGLRKGGVGSRILRVGDYDRDGVEDFLVSQVTNIFGSSVFLVSGRDGSRLKGTLLVEEDMESIGVSLDSDPYQKQGSARFVLNRYSPYSYTRPQNGLIVVQQNGANPIELTTEDLRSR